MDVWEEVFKSLKADGVVVFFNKFDDISLRSSLKEMLIISRLRVEYSTLWLKLAHSVQVLELSDYNLLLATLILRDSAEEIIIM